MVVASLIRTAQFIQEILTSSPKTNIRVHSEIEIVCHYGGSLR